MRFFDFIFSILGLLFLSPIILIVSVIIKATSKGPVIFSHCRIGKECKVFNCLKFRSMVDGADKVGGYMTKVNDQRITSVGAYLRKYSLDEIPQLINVLLGQMALVGPRPDTPKQMELYSEVERNKRHSIRPGITGLAQVRARHVATNRSRLKYDLFYLEKKSICFDFWILLQTVKNLIIEKSY